MPTAPERRGRWVIVGYVALIVAVALVAMPARALVVGAARPVVVRLACAVVIAVVLLHLRRGLVRRIEDEEAAAVTAPPGAPSPPVTPALDPWFVDLHESVRWSVRSERYFERVLLPRLRALARRGVDGPRPGGWGRRGRLAHLRALVARLERQP